MGGGGLLARTSDVYDFFNMEALGRTTFPVSFVVLVSIGLQYQRY